MELDHHLQNGFFESFPGFLSICDDSYRFVYLNKNLRDLLSKELCSEGVSAIGLTGLELAKYVPPHIADFIHESHSENVAISKHQLTVPRVFGVKTSEGVRYFEVVKFKHTINGRIYIFTNSTDITKLKRDVEKYRVESLTDPLTGLYNRRAYHERTNGPIQANSLIVVIDLDNFKYLNDQFGHNTGDKVLVDFANLLTRCFRQGDFLSRTGGDEFVLVLDSLRSIKVLTKRLEKLDLYFKTAFHEKYPFLGWSYGVENIGSSFTTAVEAADKRMYEYKRKKVSNTQCIRST